MDEIGSQIVPRSLELSKASGGSEQNCREVSRDIVSVLIHFDWICLVVQQILNATTVSNY